MKKLLAWGLFEKTGAFLAAVSSRAVARRKKSAREAGEKNTIIRRVVITIS